MDIIPDSKLEMEKFQQVVVESPVLGPFETLVRYSGFYLPKNRSRSVSLAATAVCGLLIAAFIVNFILAMTKESPPLTLKWAGSNMMLGICFYGMPSAVCLILWTRSGFLESFQTQMAKVRNLRVLANETMDDYTSVHLKSSIFGAILVAAYLLTSLREIAYPMEKLRENETFTMTYPVSLDSLFGFGPIIFFWMGVVSLAATLLYSYSMLHVEREFNYFNQELQKASRAQQLTVPDIFAAYGRRHYELMLLLKHINAHLGKFGSIAIVGPILIFANSIFIMVVFIKEASIVAVISIIVWNKVSIGMMMTTVGQPAKIQEEVHNTTCILMDDETIPTATDSRIQHSYRTFLDRCEHRSTMHAMNAFAIDRNFMHKMLMIVPNIGTLMAFIVKLRTE